MTTRDVWGTDGPVSKPGPIRQDRPVLVQMGGFAFTTGGMAHDLNEEEIAEVFFPTFAPEGFDG